MELRKAETEINTIVVVIIAIVFLVLFLLLLSGVNTGGSDVLENLDQFLP